MEDWVVMSEDAGLDVDDWEEIKVDPVYKGWVEHSSSAGAATCAWCLADHLVGCALELGYAVDAFYANFPYTITENDAKEMLEKKMLDPRHRSILLSALTKQNYIDDLSILTTYNSQLLPPLLRTIKNVPDTEWKVLGVPLTGAMARIIATMADPRLWHEHARRHLKLVSQKQVSTRKHMPKPDRQCNVLPWPF